jgi:hypothetical protein
LVSGTTPEVEEDDEDDNKCNTTWWWRPSFSIPNLCPYHDLD